MPANFDYLFRFPSLLEPKKYAYTFHVSSYWGDSRNRDYCLWPNAGMYETYGDGMIQHSHEYQPGKDRMSDYFGSLAAFLLQPGKLDQYGKELVYAWGFYYLRSDKVIDFASTVLYNEKKTRYFTVEGGLKISASPSKQYDKRWCEIKTWMDGSVESVYRILRPDYADFFQSFRLYCHVRDYAIKWEWQVCGAHPLHYFKLIPEGDGIQEHRGMYSAYEVVDDLLKAQAEKLDARTNFENWRCATKVDDEVYSEFYKEETTNA